MASMASILSSDPSTFMPVDPNTGIPYALESSDSTIQTPNAPIASSNNISSIVSTIGGDILAGIGLEKNTPVVIGAGGTITPASVVNTNNMETILLLGVGIVVLWFAFRRK